eukprot:TRINITY_DN80227_c0_g1_i1.p1 TRINITY_DN80227_c0_g1~~TRINITY_DN80227_c0_g1_i1.p1  ORF type:complete len:368 (-),score=48.33 TRINITY_DN80227_c0_g1_i1:65-1141(-)
MARPFSISLLTTLVVISEAATRLKVKHYDGPKFCHKAERVFPGDWVKFHYIASIDNSSKTGVPGTETDNSYKRHHPMELEMGAHFLIEGLDHTLVGLCKGAKANLTIPPQFAWGSQDLGPDVPAGATYNFDVHVLSISRRHRHPDVNVFDELDTDNDGKVSREEHEQIHPHIHPDSHGHFDSQDKNGDGFIDWHETDDMHKHFDHSWDILEHYPPHLEDHDHDVSLESGPPKMPYHKMDLNKVHAEEYDKHMHPHKNIHWNRAKLEQFQDGEGHTGPHPGGDPQSGFRMNHPANPQGSDSMEMAHDSDQMVPDSDPMAPDSDPGAPGSPVDLGDLSHEPFASSEDELQQNLHGSVQEL